MDLVKKVCDNSLDDNLSMERVTWFSNSMSGVRMFIRRSLISSAMFEIK